MSKRGNSVVKQWYLTYSQCKFSREELLDHLNDIDLIVEYLICQELHKDGNTHYHAYVKYETGVAWKDLLKFKFNDRTANAEAVRSMSAVLKYCSKDDEYITNIKNLESLIKKSKKRKVIGEIFERGALWAVENGACREIDYKRLKASVDLYRLDTAPVEATDDCKGHWISGPTGIGKTHHVHERWPDHFKKSANKWWDGYAGEEVVVMDDLGDKVGPMLTYHLKHWMDKWPSPAGEVKGGSIPLPFKVFVVTSQWTIDEMFHGMDRDRDAIKRRCRGRIVCMNDENLSIGTFICNDLNRNGKEPEDGAI